MFIWALFQRPATETYLIRPIKLGKCGKTKKYEYLLHQTLLTSYSKLKKVLRKQTLGSWKKGGVPTSLTISCF